LYRSGDVSGDLKDVAEIGATTNVVEDMRNVAEDMTVAEKEAEATKNGIRNETEEGKSGQCLIVRGYT
jgi:hypothetical protein